MSGAGLEAVRAEVRRLASLGAAYTVGAGRVYLAITRDAVTLCTAPAGVAGVTDAEAFGRVEGVELPAGVTPEAVAGFLGDPRARDLVLRVVAGLGEPDAAGRGALSWDGRDAARELGGDLRTGGYVAEYFADGWEAGLVVAAWSARDFFDGIRADLHAAADADEAAALACSFLDGDGVNWDGDGAVYVGHAEAAAEARRVWAEGREPV